MQQAISIHSEHDVLSFNAQELPLATVDQYNSSDRCVGSIFEALEPGEVIQLQEGFFVLDEDLDLKKTNWKIIAKNGDGDVCWEGGPHGNLQVHLSLLSDLDQQNPGCRHEVVLA